MRLRLLLAAATAGASLAVAAPAGHACQPEYCPPPPPWCDTHLEKYVHCYPWY
jgi:hypothetical protein